MKACFIFLKKVDNHKQKEYNSFMMNIFRKGVFGWWLGFFAFALIVGGMLIDILYREGLIGDRKSVLVVGTHAGFKPFEYLENGKVVGFDIDISKEVAKSLGKELKIEDSAFDGLLPALESGQVDMVIAGMTKTPEREKNVLFSKPYYSAAQKIVVQKGSSIKNKYELSGNKIGVQLGTTSDTIVSKIDGVNIVKLQSVPSVLQDLTSGKIDAAVLDEAPAKQYLQGFSNLEVLPDSLSDEDYAVAIKKGNEELQNQVNKVIAEMKKDGRYQALLEKYFGEKEKK